MASCKCKDHLGNEFNSKREMCAYWNVLKCTLNRRLKKGISLEQALIGKDIPHIKSEKVIDYLGNEFNSKREMCEKYGIPYSTFSTRINKLKWSLERALTIPIEEYVEDHLGNKFKDLNELANEYNIPYATLYNRINELKWTMHDALTTPVKDDTCIDHLGNKFNNMSEMFRFYNIAYEAGRSRLKSGYSLEQVLTTPYIDKIKHIDPITKELMTMTDICKKYKVSISFFSKRIERGYNSTIALDISIAIFTKYNKVNKTKYNLTIAKRIKPGKDVFECYIDNGDGTSTFRIMSYDMIDEYCIEQYKKLHNIQ